MSTMRPNRRGSNAGQAIWCSFTTPVSQESHYGIIVAIPFVVEQPNGRTPAHQRSRSAFCRGGFWFRMRTLHARGGCSWRPGSAESFGVADLAPDTADAFLGGRLRLYQPSSGHRAGTDTVLLAASVPATASGLAIDVGAGVGAVGLAAALAAPGLRIALLERESALAALARANVAANRLDGRAFVAHADLLSPDSCRAAGLEPASADLVLTNPPFLSGDKARISPDAGQAKAQVIGAGGLVACIHACLALLKSGGTFLMIHRADALAEILQS